MKKKLEAELISIAHRILKLKNRAELDQLQQETLKLYEKISVLRFVEDNFSDVKPTIGQSSAEETLEAIYGLEEQPEVKANEEEAKEDKAREEKKEEKKAERENEEADAEKDNAAGEGVSKDESEAPVSAEEKEATEESEEEVVEQDSQAESKSEKAEVEEVKQEEPKSEEKKEEKAEEPEHKIEIEKPAEELEAMEAGAAAVFEKEDDATIEEEEQAADAEVVTIEPDSNTKVEDSGLNIEFAFERPAAPEEPAKQKEITFEDYKDYKEPEFVKKSDIEKPKEEAPKAEEKKEPEYKDWRDWEPSKSAEAEEKKEEPKTAAPEEPKQEGSTVKGNIASRTDFERAKSLNDSFGKSITLGLNDRIAFEKNLFGGSADDLNRVLSQLNTIDTFEEAKGFITELVKPDYNNWEGKEEYEERFMALVEKKYN